MARPRSSKVDSRNVKLDIPTYDRLDKYVIELVNQKGERKITLGDAVAALLDEHDRKAVKKS
ncbi:MAG: hypothetical protein ABSG74_07405 [Candidatus Bathyarchaeia archaeon]|jgi:hypothetical protein